MILHKSVLLRHYQWESVQSIMDVLKSSGFQVYLAGGCVRDALLGRRPHDLDLATNAKPEEVESLFSKTIDVGKSFGVIRVLLDNCDIEVATFRKDGNYEDGRRPENVEFSDAKEDCLRRDFTMNALFYDFDKDEVLDYVGGISDLRSSLIKAVGDADKRFDEDQLRMFRALRFAAQLGFDIDGNTLNAIKKHSWRINNVSGERIHEEFAKFFLGTFKVANLSLLKVTGIEQALFPGMMSGKWLDVPIQSFIEGLCLYFRYDIENKNIDQYLEKLKLSSKEKKFFNSFKKTLMNADKIKSIGFGKLLQAYADPAVRFACQTLVFENACPEIEAIHLKWLQMNEELPVPFLSGKDVLAIKNVEGKLLGQLLQECYELQMEEQIDSKEKSLTWLMAKI